MLRRPTGSWRTTTRSSPGSTRSGATSTASPTLTTSTSHGRRGREPSGSPPPDWLQRHDGNPKPERSVNPCVNGIRLLLNVIWLVLHGWALALAYLLAG